MTLARPADYWFSASALYIQLNAAGDPNYIHANTSSGSAVLCYMRGIDGLGYDNGHNYRRWNLIASPTVFHDNAARYVYIAIPKSNAVDVPAQVVFPSEMIDLYGCNEGGTQVGPTDYYYIFTQGIISASEVNGVRQNRTWQQDVNCGQLASDEALANGGADSWWEWNSVTDMVRFLKTISEAVFQRLEAAWASITQLVLNGHTLNGVADPETAEDANAADKVVTPAYAKTQYLSRTHDDTAAGDITFNNSILVKGETVLKRSVTIGNYEKDIQVGIGSRTGAKILPDGTIVARNLELSESLSVPTIKYNSIEVLAGTRWDSAGKGRIKEIIAVDENAHTCQFVLDLNDGEPGEFLVNDILRGFWHNMDGTKNAQTNTDDRRGNITRAGFQSIYCRVMAVANVVERVTGDVTEYIAQDNNYIAQQGDKLRSNGLVTVQMRQYDNGEDPATWSPMPEQWAVLSVSGFFGTDHPERQKFFVYTTSYMARFEGVNTWEWEEHCFMGGWGDLTGFAMIQEDEHGNVTRKEFNGEGFVTKDAHIYGILEQFTRFSDRIDIMLSRPDGTIADGENLRADFILRNVEGTTITSGYALSITRQSGNAQADAAWNAAMAARYPSGIPSALYFQFADIPENGAVYVIAASRQVPDGNGGYDTYTTSASFVLSRAYAQEVFMGDWNALTTYVRTARTYPTVTYGGCKWWLAAASSTDDEPHPLSNVWKMVYGLADLEIRFYNEAGQRITSAAAYPGAVNIYLDPHLLCGQYDITSYLQDSDWSWERYTGNYGEQTDTRNPADKQSDQGWRNAHWPSQPTTRTLRITNADMPPAWGSGPVVHFIVTCNYDNLIITNTVTL